MELAQNQWLYSLKMCCIFTFVVLYYIFTARDVFFSILLMVGPYRGVVKKTVFLRSGPIFPIIKWKISQNMSTYFEKITTPWPQGGRGVNLYGQPDRKYIYYIILFILYILFFKKRRARYGHFFGKNTGGYTGKIQAFVFKKRIKAFATKVCKCDMLTTKEHKCDIFTTQINWLEQLTNANMH